MTRSSAAFRFLPLIVIMMMLLSAGCNGRSVEDRRLKPPFEHLTKVGDDELRISLSDKVDASAFYDLRIFSGLSPGTTLCEAVAILGPAGRAYEEKRRQNRVFPFSTGLGTVEIYHHRVPSDDEEIVWEFHWGLRARPADATLEQHFPRSVIELLEAETLAPKYSVTLLSDFASVRYELEAQEIRQIIWNAAEKDIRRNRASSRGVAQRIEKDHQSRARVTRTVWGPQLTCVRQP